MTTLVRARSRRRSLLAVFLAALLANGAWASDAVDLFDEVVYHLALSYGGPSDVRMTDVAPQYEAQLLAACEPFGNECPSYVARPIVQELVTSLGDPHTNFLDPSEFESVRAVLGGDGENRSFGFVLAVEPSLVGFVLLEVHEDSPAHRAGLQRGDHILGFDGRYPFGSPERRYDVLLDVLERDDAVRVTVERAGTGRFDVQLRAEAISSVRPPALEIRDDGIAVLRIPAFVPAGVVSERVHELLHDSGLHGSTTADHSGLVIDVRHNPGGIVDECYGAAAAFVDEASEAMRTPVLTIDLVIADGSLRRQIGDTPSTSPVASRPARYLGPVAVLVNSRSGSCSEFFARLLQDAGASVVGEQTGGVADTATNFRSLFDGSGLQITIAQVTQGDGSSVPAYVTPDEASNDDLLEFVRGRDIPLERAVALLNEHR